MKNQETHSKRNRRTAKQGSDVAIPKAHNFLKSYRMSNHEFVDMIGWASYNGLEMVTSPRMKAGTIMFYWPEIDENFAMYRTGYVRRLKLRDSKWIPQIHNREELSLIVPALYPNDYRAMFGVLQNYIARRKKKLAKQKSL